MHEILALHVSHFPEDWVDRIASNFQEMPWRSEKSRNSLLVYEVKQPLKIKPGLAFVFGCKVQRLWLGESKWGLSFLPHRLYLDGNNQRIIRPERDLVDLNKKPQIPLQKRISFLNRVMGHLLSSSAFSNATHLDSLELISNLEKNLNYSSGKFQKCATSSLRNFSQQHFRNTKIRNRGLLVIPDSNIPENLFHNFLNQIQVTFNKYQCDIKLFTPGLKKLISRFHEMGTSQTAHAQDFPIWFLLPPRDHSFSQEIKSAFKKCDELEIPWRRAHSNDDFQWSVPDQFPSVAQALGYTGVGISHPEIQTPWSIGIDLSLRKQYSRACAVLIDPFGRMIKGFTLDLGSRKENLQGQQVKRLVQCCLSEIPHNDPNNNLLVIRDGRLFESEIAEDYQRAFNGKTTLIEFRKYNNPPILINGQLPDSPALVWDSTQNNELTGFLSTLPQGHKNEFDRVFKIHTQSRWNGCGYSMHQLGQILTSLSVAPGLGLHPKSLPSPIYWADGIAGASDSDLRFRGQNVTHLGKDDTFRS